MVRILINGIMGHMGRAVFTAASSFPDRFQLSGGVDPSYDGSEAFPFPVFASYAQVDVPADVIIDFSVPAALPSVLAYAVKAKCGAMIGTTGLSDRDLQLIAHAAESVPVFRSGNMSLGVNLQIELCKRAAATLGETFDVEIIEKHHNRKVDSPSGTALMLADGIRSISGGDKEYVFGRHEKNKRRQKDEIGFHSVRGGTIVGEHEVLFIGPDEVVEINHRAFSKQIFAMGALRAAEFIATQPSGLFSMADVLTQQDVASKLYVHQAQAAVTVSGFPSGSGAFSTILKTVADAKVSLDMISYSLPESKHAVVGFSIPQKELTVALQALQPLRDQYPALQLSVLGNGVKLTIEGAGMAFRYGVTADLMRVLSLASVRAELITTSETKIEVLVDAVNTAAAISAVEDSFLSKLF